MKPDECEGCASFGKRHEECGALGPRREFHKPIISVLECPCTDCLIKTMCKDACDDFKEKRWHEYPDN